MPVGYGEIFNWLVAAIGAALLLGTGAALLTYRRTGAFPGGPPGQTPQQDVGEGQPKPTIRTAVAKCVLGALLIVVGITRLVAGDAL